MKETVFSCKTIGTKSRIELDILLDINRELTETDARNIRELTDNLLNALREETIKLDPESKTTAEKEKAEIIGVFGNRAIFVEEVPNGYCSQYCCKHLPWFVVTTNKGRIKIGWRKRVIHIEWTDTIINEDAETLFPNEDVTRYNKIIHAWGCEKASEYINVLLK